MADWWNPFDDESGVLAPSAAAPAAQYGKPRTGGGPQMGNFQLGGNADYANNFSAAGNAEYGRRAGAADAASAEVAARATPSANYDQANEALGVAQQGEANQQGVYSSLMNFANGPQGPSGAQAMLNEGANRSLRGNLATARSGTGFGESAGAMANAQRQHVDATASAGNQAAMLKANEDQQFRANKLNAFGQAGGIAGQQSNAALGRAGAAAGMSQFNTSAGLEAERNRDATRLAYGDQALNAYGAGRSQELDAQRANLEGSMGFERTNADIYGAEMEHQLGTRELNQKRSNDVVGGVTGLISGAGSIASLGVGSDRRMKKGVRKTSLADKYEALR